MIKGKVLVLIALTLALLYLISTPAKFWIKDKWEYFLWLADVLKAPKYTNSNLIETTSPVFSQKTPVSTQLCNANCSWDTFITNADYQSSSPIEADFYLNDTERVYPLKSPLACLPKTFGYSKSAGDQIFPLYGYPKCEEIASDPSTRIFLDYTKNQLLLNCPGEYPGKVLLGPTDTRRLVMRREVEDSWEVLMNSKFPMTIQPHHEFAFGSCSPDSQFFDQAVYILRPNQTAYRDTLAKMRTLQKNVTKRPFIVLLLVIDSYSRKHFYRKMPLTSQYLNGLNKGNQYRVFDFKLHNVIGGNSVANQMPILAEKSPVDDFHPNQDFTGNSSLWSIYKEHGFMTYFGFEDCDDSFPRKIGRMPKVDHATNPFYCGVYKYTDCRMSKSSQKQRCIGAHMSHYYILNYTKQFSEAYPLANQWLYVHLSAAHEASGQHAETLDEDLRDYLRLYLEDFGAKSEVVVLLEADHGMRYGDWYKSIEAFQENRLPVFFTIASKRLLDSIPYSYDVLKHNSFRLNSKLDLRRTSIYLSRLPYDLPEVPTQTDAVNLFTEKVKDNRTCEELHIPHWHCSCLELQRIGEEEQGEFRDVVRYLGEYAISVMNSEVYTANTMRKGALCMKLHLHQIESVYGVRLTSMSEELKLELSITESASFRIEVTFLLTSSLKKSKEGGFLDDPVIYNGFRKTVKLLNYMRLDRYVGACEAAARKAELNPEICICEF